MKNCYGSYSRCGFKGECEMEPWCKDATEYKAHGVIAYDDEIETEDPNVHFNEDSDTITAYNLAQVLALLLCSAQGHPIRLYIIIAHLSGLNLSEIAIRLRMSKQAIHKQVGKLLEKSPHLRRFMKSQFSKNKQIIKELVPVCDDVRGNDGRKTKGVS